MAFFFALVTIFIAGTLIYPGLRKRIKLFSEEFVKIDLVHFVSYELEGSALADGQGQMLQGFSRISVK